MLLHKLLNEPSGLEYVVQIFMQRQLPALLRNERLFLHLDSRIDMGDINRSHLLQQFFPKSIQLLILQIVAAEHRNFYIESFFKLFCKPFQLVAVSFISQQCQIGSCFCKGHSRAFSDSISRFCHHRFFALQ